MSIISVVEPTWLYIWRHDETISTSYKNILEFILSIYYADIAPSKENIFRAFSYFPWYETRVVIVGQDPYPGRGDADGLCFSSMASTTPASLRHIKDVLKRTYGVVPESNSLEYLAKQGVLLMNTALTTVVGSTNVHSAQWSAFTSAIIKFLTNTTECYFILWGNPAKALGSEVPFKRKAVYYHPAAYGVYAFDACDSFVKIDTYMKEAGLPVIDWVNRYSH